jgi:hypothetical protein
MGKMIAAIVPHGPAGPSPRPLNISRVSWPTIGDLLPRAAEARNLHEKLERYVLNASHAKGAAKARGFAEVLGIGSRDADYLAEALLKGIAGYPITDVRDNAPYGILTEVRLAVRGLRSSAITAT